MPSWWSLGCSQVPQLGLAGRQSYWHLLDKAFIKPSAKSQRLLFHVIVIYWQHIQYFIALKLTSRVSLWRYAWGNRHAYVSHMFCECISNWYEVYWISKWIKAQEQQNSHKQNSVAYPADCLPNCSPVYLSISCTYYLVPGNMITYQHKYMFTTVVTTACSDNDVLYFSVISCEFWLSVTTEVRSVVKLREKLSTDTWRSFYESKPHQLLVHIVVQTYSGCALAASNNCCRIYDY